MISKEGFVAVMISVKTLISDMESADNALRKLDSDFGGFPIGRIEEEIFKVLKSTLNDTNDYIGDFVYESDWKGCTVLNILTGNKVPLLSLEDLYDALIKEGE